MLAERLQRYYEELEKKGFEQGFKQAFEQYFEQGKLVEKQEIAMKLFKEVSELEFISKMTEITVKELQDLVK